MPSVTKRVRKGIRFRSVYADSNALWEVVKKAGPKAWECEIVNEPIVVGDKTYSGDYAGVRKLFSTGEILGAAAHERTIREVLNASDEWFSNQPIGSIVHYHNGFGEYLRCEVVDEEFDGVSPSLLPLALVGNWKSYDLPKRDRYGKMQWGYHAKNILEGKVFRPHASCVYEYNKSGPVHPATMPEIDLNVPELTAEEVEAARLWDVVNAIHEVAAGKLHKGPSEILSAIKVLIDANLDGTTVS